MGMGTCIHPPVCECVYVCPHVYQLECVRVCMSVYVRVHVCA